jgi:hypothetical protein
VKRIATIMHGPQVWQDAKQGDVIFENDKEVVVLLQGRDDAGHAFYEVRMPIACVKIEEVEELADSDIIIDD